MPDAARERLVFTVGQDWTAPCFDADGAIAVPRPAFAGEYTLYDTFDFVLARTGASIARDHTGTWRIDIVPLVAPARPVHVEHPGAVDDDSVPDDLRRLVEARTLGAELRVVARVEVVVRPTDLVTLDGHRQATIEHQVHEVVHGDAERQPRPIVTIEAVLDCSLALVDELAQQVVAAGGTPISPHAAVVQILGRRATFAPPLPRVVTDENADVASVIRATLAAHVRRLVAHDPGLRTDEDVVAVHQARVATRRLRADLATFRPFLDPDWVDALAAPLQGLGAALGTVRDLDVLVGRLEHDRDSLPPPDHAAANRLINRARAERTQAQRALRITLNHPAYLELVARLVSAAQAPFTTPRADARAVDALPRRPRRQWKQLRQAVAALPPDAPDAAWHSVRIRAKRTRYATDAVVRVGGRPAKQFSAAMAAVQAVLGEHQDAVTSAAWIRDRATALPAADQFVAGALTAIETAAADASRHRFPAVWSNASDPLLRTWWK